MVRVLSGQKTEVVWYKQLRHQNLQCSVSLAILCQDFRIQGKEGLFLPLGQEGRGDYSGRPQLVSSAFRWACKPLVPATQAEVEVSLHFSSCFQIFPVSLGIGRILSERKKKRIPVSQHFTVGLRTRTRIQLKVNRPESVLTPFLMCPSGSSLNVVIESSDHIECLV